MKGRLNISLATAAALLAAAAALNSCSAEKPYTRDTYVMGTRAVITIYGMDEEAAGAAASAALHELHRVESVMSAWAEESEISHLNDASGGGPFELSEELYSMIERSIGFSDITDGAFDITSGPLIALWGFRGGEPSVPEKEQIDSVLALTGSRRIELDREKRTVTLPPGMRLDLGGIGKGYAVDRCAEILRSMGAHSALINLGGNMYALGSPEGREYWSIGIRDPRGGDSVVGKLLLRDEAVATSGNYENFVIMEGKTYGHIIDPRTGLTAAGLLSVTVVAPTAIEADALSTGMFVLGLEDSAPIIELNPSIRAVFALDDDSFQLIGMFGKTLVLD